MGLDITHEFKNLVKKASHNAGKVDSSILHPVRQPDIFTKNAFQVSCHIKSTKEFMQTQRNRYIIPGMASDNERDQIEQEMVSFIKNCSASVDHLSRVAQQNKSSSNSDHEIAHQHGMVLIISEELKDLTLLLDQYRSQRAMQVRSLQQRRRKQQTKQEERMKSQHLSPDVASSSGNSSAVLAPQQQEIIQAENKALFEELSTFSDRVHETEKMMVEISTLNQMLCGQIMSQADQIEQVYNDAVNSSDNMIRGNIHLKKAIETNTSTQKYLLVLLISAALILLFFDRFYS